MRRVGIFDSGIGGLMIAKEAIGLSISAEIFYVSDDQFSPYGTLDQSDILERSVYCTKLLVDQGVEMITVGCNTATAAAISHLRNQFDLTFVGVEPDLNFLNREIKNVDKDVRIAVLTTSYTGVSKKFLNLKNRRDPEENFIYIELKQLAPLIEEYYYSSGSTEVERKIDEELKKYIQPNQFDYVVLGCTHYEYIKFKIEEICQCKCISPSHAVAKRMISFVPTNSADSCPQAINFYSTEKNAWSKFSLENLNYWPR